MFLAHLLPLVALHLLGKGVTAFDNITAKPICRNLPGSGGYPSNNQWVALNMSLSGRLSPTVPTIKYCRSIPTGCTPEQLLSSVFRIEIPGSMGQPNWEQDYDSVPPSLCTPETVNCGQGNVPLYGVLAETILDVQTGVKFAQDHNLRLAVKSSGHDYLGRSTAKDSLLIWMHKFQNITFTDHYIVGGIDKGSAVTLGSGVTLQEMYKATKAQDKIVVGGSSATVAAAGGYIQGAGHSALSPKLGLAADNCLAFRVVLANGTLVTVNEAENSDLFWAMRGGGAGSWGVIIDATFRTFPTFDAVRSIMIISASTISSMAQVMTIHARHLPEWDNLRVGQYFFLTTSNFTKAAILPGPSLLIESFFPDATLDQANAALKPFLDDISGVANVSVFQVETVLEDINDLLSLADDVNAGYGINAADVYRDSPETVGEVYTQLLEVGTETILGNLIAGGKVSENRNVSNAVIPAWRKAKTHIIIANTWSDNATITEILNNQTFFGKRQLPILQTLTGPDAGSYSNEADGSEKQLQTVFFGPNYRKLSQIKSKYDPTDLFIVRAGVGSERWDVDGLCRV